MDGQPTRQWGMTPPIATNLPTEKELALNDAMVAELKTQNNFEAPEETEKRSARALNSSRAATDTYIYRLTVLRSLQKITVEFVKLVGKKKGLSQTAINESGGKIFTFGSYRLGVFGPGMRISSSIQKPCDNLLIRCQAPI